MKALVSYGGIIGAVVIAIYCFCVRIYYIVKGKKPNKKQRKNVYLPLIAMAAMEVALILVSIIVPRVTNESYLIDGTDMTIGGMSVITKTEFKVSYIESNRNYSNRITLSEDELKNIRAVCSSKKGTVSLRITQDDQQVIVDITNTDVLLDMSPFEAGDIRFTLINENARNVKFELVW